MTTLDVTDYGASGNGSDDDTYAIQQAIDDASDGDTVYLPEPDSYYKVYPGDSGRADALTIDGSTHADNLTLEGENANTMIKVDGSTSVNHSILLIASPDNHSVTIKSLVFDGNKSNVGNAWPSFNVVFRDTNASGTGSHSVKNVTFQNGIGHGVNIQYGGVTLDRCTAIGNYRHGFVANTGSSQQFDPAPELKNCLSKNNATSGGGWYNIDCTTGKLKATDCVSVGGEHGTKVSDNAISYDLTRVRLRDGNGGAFRSSNDMTSADVSFEDVVVTGFTDFFKLDDDNNYSVVGGSELVVSNCASGKKAQIYITDSASLDASNATIYSNRANTAVGLSHSSSSSNTIDTYSATLNDNGAFGGTDNLDIGSSDEADKTDISGVPTESDVGAWSDSTTDSTPSSSGFDDWTPRWASTTDDWTVVSGTSYDGGNALQFANDGTDRTRYAISWDTVGTPSDIEILDKFRCPSFNADSFRGYHARSHIRSSSDSSGENGYWLEVEAPENAFRLAKYTDGNLTTLARFGSPSENTFYFRRFRADGQEIKAKVWPSTEPEPSDWDVVVTDSDHSSGWVGLGSYDVEAVETDVISVGTGGESAPAPDAPPSVAWSSPTDGASLSGSATIEINASDPEDSPEELTVEYRVDSGTWRATTYDSEAGTFTDTWDTTTTSNGDYELEARVTDSYGSTSSSVITVTTDNAGNAPVVDSLSATEIETSNSDAEFDADWQASDPDGNLQSTDIALVRDSDGSTTDSATVSISGDTATGTTRLVAADDDGSGNSYTVEFAVTDGKGNSTSATTSTTETEDTGEAPTIHRFSVSEAGRPDPHAEVTAMWDVSDADDDLVSVDIDVADHSGTVKGVSWRLSGTSASDTDSFKIKNGDGQTFDVSLTVTDAAGKSTSKTVSVSA